MRRWLRRALLLLAVLAAGALTIALWFGHRYGLEYGAAARNALQPRATFTIDVRRLPLARFERVLWLGYVRSERASEISGLAVSPRTPGLLWSINDSGDGPFLYALGEDGSDRGTVRVRGAQNIDWEDLAAFELDGKSYLLIADVGDNLSWRPAVTLYVVEEPVLQGARFGEQAQVDPIWILRARLQGGPADCEAVAVDARARRILLLSKRTVPPVLYSLPLVARRDAPRGRDDLLVAQRMTTVPGIPQPSARDLELDPEYGAGSARPTALDVSADGARAVVLTYKEGYVFERAAGEGWAQAFAHVPVRVRMPYMKAMEAGGFAPDGRTIYATSEFLPTPIFRFEGYRR
jgi:hypothetical protein